jgi:hypothetical protein
VSGPNWEAVNPEMIAQNCSARHIQSVIEDAKRDIAALSEEVKALREELEGQADGSAMIAALLDSQTGPVAISLRGMIALQEENARATLARFQENK